MDANNRKNVYRKIIVDLFSNKDNIESYYDDIITLLKNGSDVLNQYLINALLYLNITSVNLQMLINQYQLNSLINFLTINNDDNELINDTKTNKVYRTEPISTYSPLNEADALNIIFCETDNLKLPPTGETKKIIEHFAFEENEIKKECIRTFEINNNGEVIKYYGEKVRNLINEDLDSYYAGVLGKKYKTIDETEL